MTVAPAPDTGTPPRGREHAVVTVARNVVTRYVLIGVNVVIGLVLLPYNVRHLGEAQYGLWTLAASITAYFTMLDLGYGGAVIKFVAEFRARRDVQALNEVLSTMAYLFTAIGVIAYAIAAIIAAFLPYIFNLEPDQVQAGRLVLLMIALQVAVYFRFSIYGAVTNGFEKYYINNVTGLLFNIATAAVNVIVLWQGYGLVELVAATTLMRIAPLWVYRRNAYAVFPELRIRRAYVRRDRLRDLSRFSVHLAVADWSSRATYMTDTFYVGIFMNTAAVGVYGVAQRISEALLNLTHQLHTLMMPAVVSRSMDAGAERQRSLMVRATRVQLAIAMCLCGAVAALAQVLITRWFGPGLDGSIAATQLLCVAAVLRACTAMPGTVLQGAGDPRYVAIAGACSAAVNLAVTIPLLFAWGLAGVALGTVVSASIAAVLIFPRACRLVGLGVVDGCRRIIWPTAWPAALVMLLLSAVRTAIPAGFLPVLTVLAGGCLLYAVVFFAFGLDRDERRWFIDAASRLAGHPRAIAPSEAA